jgi:hypothetical protein
MCIVDGEKTVITPPLRQFRSRSANENLTFFAGSDQLKRIRYHEYIFSWPTFRCGAHVSFIGSPSTFRSVLLFFKNAVPSQPEHRAFYTDFEAWKRIWFTPEWVCRECRSSRVSSQETHAALHVLKHIAVSVCGVCLKAFSSLETLDRHARLEHSPNFKNSAFARLCISRDAIPSFIRFLKSMGWALIPAVIELESALKDQVARRPHVHAPAED